MNIPEKAVEAAARAMHLCPTMPPGGCGHEMLPRELAVALLGLEAAEKVWPHEAPKRDPASTTHAVLERAPQRTLRGAAETREPFGFGRRA